MKRLAVFLFTAIVFFALSLGLVNSQPVEFYTKKISGFTVNVVEVDIKDPSVNVKPAVAENDSKPGYPKETLASFINRTNPVAVINGTYHDTITYKPTGTIIVDGKVENIGCVGTVVGFNYNGTVEFYLADGLKKYYIPWNTFEHVICTGPTLVFAGELYLNAKKEGFKDPRVLGYAERSVLGLTDEGKLIFATIKNAVSLRQTAQIMLALKCKYAVCLDGGSSSGLYYNGKYLTYSNRKITNALAVTYNGLQYGGFIQTAYNR